MTNEDAIKWLNNLRQDIGQMRHSDLWHYEQAIEEIMELLKEQEAVEPITEHHLFLCPVCKNTLFREQKFCHECGKRIKWEGR